MTFETGKRPLLDRCTGVECVVGKRVQILRWLVPIYGSEWFVAKWIATYYSVCSSRNMRKGTSVLKVCS